MLPRRVKSRRTHAVSDTGEHVETGVSRRTFGQQDDDTEPRPLTAPISRSRRSSDPLATASRPIRSSHTAAHPARDANTHESTPSVDSTSTAPIDIEPQRKRQGNTLSRRKRTELPSRQFVATLSVEATSTAPRRNRQTASMCERDLENTNWQATQHPRRYQYGNRPRHPTNSPLSTAYKIG